MEKQSSWWPGSYSYVFILEKTLGLSRDDYGGLDDRLKGRVALLLWRELEASEKRSFKSVKDLIPELADLYVERYSWAAAPDQIGQEWNGFPLSILYNKEDAQEIARRANTDRTLSQFFESMKKSSKQQFDQESSRLESQYRNSELFKDIKGYAAFYYAQQAWLAKEWSGFPLSVLYKDRDGRRWDAKQIANSYGLTEAEKQLLLTMPTTLTQKQFEDKVKDFLELQKSKPKPKPSYSSSYGSSYSCGSSYGDNSQTEGLKKIQGYAKEYYTWKTAKKN